MDVTEHFDCMKAERKGTNTLILRKLDHIVQSLDNTRCQYELEYRWHSSSEAHITSVQGNEFTFWQAKDVRGWKKKSLFDMFQLF